MGYRPDRGFAQGPEATLTGFCPRRLWVIRRRGPATVLSPLYPQQETWRSAGSTSALGPEADMGISGEERNWDRRDRFRLAASIVHYPVTSRY